MPIGLPRSPRLPTITALVSLVVALIAVGVAVAAWLRPLPEGGSSPAEAPTYTDQQIADAKANVCAAYTVVKNAVALNTHQPAPSDDDKATSIALAANARLAIYAAGDYLLVRLASQPAAPADLTNAVQSLGNSYLDTAIHALNNESDSDLDPLRRAVDTNIAAVDRLCK